MDQKQEEVVAGKDVGSANAATSEKQLEEHSKDYQMLTQELRIEEISETNKQDEDMLCTETVLSEITRINASSPSTTNLELILISDSVRNNHRHK